LLPQAVIANEANPTFANQQNVIYLEPLHHHPPSPSTCHPGEQPVPKWVKRGTMHWTFTQVHWFA